MIKLIAQSTPAPDPQFCQDLADSIAHCPLDTEGFAILGKPYPWSYWDLPLPFKCNVPAPPRFPTYVPRPADARLGSQTTQPMQLSNGLVSGTRDSSEELCNKPGISVQNNAVLAETSSQAITEVSSGASSSYSGRDKQK